jgi:hypothetical protein
MSTFEQDSKLKARFVCPAQGSLETLVVAEAILSTVIVLLFLPMDLKWKEASYLTEASKLRVRLA